MPASCPCDTRNTLCKGNGNSKGCVERDSPKCEQLKDNTADEALDKRTRLKMAGIMGSNRHRDKLHFNVE